MLALLAILLAAGSPMPVGPAPLQVCGAGDFVSGIYSFKKPVCATPAGGGGGGAPTTAQYWTGAADATLSAEKNLGALATALVLNTGGTPSAYAGSSCGASQYATSSNGSGAWTCAQVLTSQLSGTVTDAQLANNYSGTGACAAGRFASTLNDNAAPSCTQVAYTDVSGTPTIPTDISGAHYVTTQAEAGLSAEAVLPTCTGTDKLTFNGTTISCAADQTGSGGGNLVEVDIDFGAGGNTNANTVVTGQSWVTASSKILCTPTMLATSTRAEGAEDAILEGLTVAVYSRVAGTGFTVAAAAYQGRAYGTFKVHCSGS
jgi:hypothetical protein